MKVRLIKYAMMLLMPMSGVLRTSAQEPRLRMSTTDVFMGRAKATETLTDSVMIYNDGTADLTLHSIFTGCSCTEASFPRQTVAPGDSMTIKLRFHDKRQPPGRFRKLLRIRSNDSSSPTRFFITGVIIPPNRE